jgi:serine/threonine-protein kinase
VRDHLDALKRDPRSAAAFNQLAWVWATAPDPGVRNGPRAKECATRACELTDWSDPGPLDTLAAACAELGEFTDAAAWQEKALALAAPADEAAFRERLDLYRGGTPYRQSPGAAGPGRS